MSPRYSFEQGRRADEELAAEPPPDGIVPYLLNVSLGAETPEGQMNRAIKQSENKLRRENGGPDTGGRRRRESWRNDPA